MEDYAGIFAIVLFFAIPILAIILGLVAGMKKHRQENELKLEIVRSGNISPEMAKELFQKPSKKYNKLIALRWGCTLVGIGLAAIVCNLVGLYISNVYTWLYLALGGGVGLVVAFVAEMMLAKRNPELTKEKE